MRSSQSVQRGRRDSFSRRATMQLTQSTIWLARHIAPAVFTMATSFAILLGFFALVAPLALIDDVLEAYLGAAATSAAILLALCLGVWVMALLIDLALIRVGLPVRAGLAGFAFLAFIGSMKTWPNLHTVAVAFAVMTLIYWTVLIVEDALLNAISRHRHRHRRDFDMFNASTQKPRPEQEV